MNSQRPVCPLCGAALTPTLGANLLDEYDAGKLAPLWMCPVAFQEERDYIVERVKMSQSRVRLNPVEDISAILAMRESMVHKCNYIFGDDDPYIRPEVDQ